MEITRQPTLGLNAPREAAIAGKAGTSLTQQPVRVAALAPAKHGLEDIQSALGQLPQVDLEKVAAIKAALACGELATDSATLAGAMLAYHRSDDR